jgi:hypothetical protein
MKSSALLQEALLLIQASEEGRSKNQLAVTSLGVKIQPWSSHNDIVSLSSIGALLRVLNKHSEDTTSRCIKSPTQRLFASDAYSYLTDAAQLLGFKTVSDADEFGTDKQWEQMWDNAMTSAFIAEEVGD